LCGLSLNGDYYETERRQQYPALSGTNGMSSFGIFYKPTPTSVTYLPLPALVPENDGKIAFPTAFGLFSGTIFSHFSFSGDTLHSLITRELVWWRVFLPVSLRVTFLEMILPCRAPLKQKRN
jgi:hypothetical protein